MKRTYLLVLGLMLLLFAGVVSRRAWTPGEAMTADTHRQDAAEKERIRQFWELHREASTLRTTGDYQGAIRQYEAALALDPEHEDALYYLSNSYIELGRVRDADSALVRLVQAHPTSSRGHSRLGDTRLCFADDAFFDLRSAEASFRTAWRVNREETGPMLRLTELLLIADRRTEARELLEAITRTNVESIEGHYLLGYTMWRDGDAAGARISFDQAMALLREKAPTTAVIGEGDRKNGAAIRPGEQLTCPLVQDLLHDLVTGTSGLEASYSTVRRKFDAMRLMNRG